MSVGLPVNCLLSSDLHQTQQLSTDFNTNHMYEISRISVRWEIPLFHDNTHATDGRPDGKTDVTRLTDVFLQLLYKRA